MLAPTRWENSNNKIYLSSDIIEKIFNKFLPISNSFQNIWIFPYVLITFGGEKCQFLLQCMVVSLKFHSSDVWFIEKTKRVFNIIERSFRKKIDRNRSVLRFQWHFSSFMMAKIQFLNICPRAAFPTKNFYKVSINWCPLEIFTFYCMKSIGQIFWWKIYWNYNNLFNINIVWRNQFIVVSFSCIKSRITFTFESV